MSAVGEECIGLFVTKALGGVFTAPHKDGLG